MDEVAPLHVALIVKNTPASFERDARNMGIFSYAIPEFTWQHLAPGKGATLDTRVLKAQGFDLVFHEDGGAWCDYVGGAIPVVYYSIDSTLSEEFHFKPRLEQAKKADLVLIDHDRLERFEPCGKPVRRLSYAVNDLLFRPAERKDIDLCFHCGGSAERGMMRALLHEFCKARGYRYVSGAVGLSEYADHMSRAKVVVNLPRNPTNRPHRVFDALSSGAALVTTPIPEVSGEVRRAGQHYLETTLECIAEKVAVLIDNQTWQLLGIGGQELVSQRHTWAVRARELREMLKLELSV